MLQKERHGKHFSEINILHTIRIVFCEVHFSILGPSGKIDVCVLFPRPVSEALKLNKYGQ